MKKWYPFDVQIFTAGFITTIGSEIWVNSASSESAKIFMYDMAINEIAKRGGDRCTVSVQHILKRPKLFILKNEGKVLVNDCDENKGKTFMDMVQLTASNGVYVDIHVEKNQQKGA